MTLLKSNILKTFIYSSFWHFFINSKLAWFQDIIALYNTSDPFLRKNQIKVYSDGLLVSILIIYIYYLSKSLLLLLLLFCYHIHRKYERYKNITLLNWDSSNTEKKNRGLCMLYIWRLHGVVESSRMGKQETRLPRRVVDRTKVVFVEDDIYYLPTLGCTTSCLFYPPVFLVPSERSIVGPRLLVPFPKLILGLQSEQAHNLRTYTTVHIYHASLHQTLCITS